MILFLASFPKERKIMWSCILLFLISLYWLWTHWPNSTQFHSRVEIQQVLSYRAWTTQGPAACVPEAVCFSANSWKVSGFVWLAWQSRSSGRPTQHRAHCSEEAVCQQVEQIEVEGSSGAENVVMEAVATGFNAFAVHRVLMVKTIWIWTQYNWRNRKLLSQLDGHSEFYIKEKVCILK